jgi:hypothetical protein
LSRKIHLIGKKKHCGNDSELSNPHDQFFIFY